MSTRLPEYHVESERSERGGYTVFVIVDEYGDYVEPHHVYHTPAAASEACRRLHQEDLANYDGPPDGEAWSGGFAENH